jgi:TonB family protein
MLKRFTTPSHSRVASLQSAVAGALVAAIQLVALFPPQGSGSNAVPHVAALHPEVRPAEYILPLWPTQVLRPSVEKVRWVGPHNSSSERRAPPAPKPKPAPAREPPVPPPTPPDEPDMYQGSHVYIEPEVERPVTRDPASGAPEYPMLLQRQRIEGTVVVRFIVDTSGHADSTSLRVVETSHPGFADAVRVALPRMKFLPAEVSGRHVPQLVMQQFRFILQHADTATLARQVGRLQGD